MSSEILIILGLGGIVYFFVLGMFAVLKKWSDGEDDEYEKDS